MLHLLIDNLNELNNRDHCDVIKFSHSGRWPIFGKILPVFLVFNIYKRTALLNDFLCWLMGPTHFCLL